MHRTIRTRKEVAELLGVQVQTITDLRKKLGVVPKPVPLNGNATGFDDDDVALFREALTPRARRRREPAAASA